VNSCRAVPPGASVDPVLARYGRAILRSPRRQTIVYLSTIGVYGDRQGAWVDETMTPAPSTHRSRTRLQAERSWAAIGSESNKKSHILRLAGIYGPGRNALVNLRSGTARRLSSEIEPRALRKRREGPSPEIDRAGKGEPFVGVRPTFDVALRRPGALARIHIHDALFMHDTRMPAGGFTKIDPEAPEAADPCTFEPWAEGESPTILATGTETSPQRRGVATMTLHPAVVSERLMQGATPILRRTDTLASATPARAELTPVEVVAHAMLSSSPTPFVPRDAGSSARARLDATGDQHTAARERRCLAEAIYFEARGESEEGQAAVAQVVLNRVASGLYPTTICGVVYQNRHRLDACQFSFARDGRTLGVREPQSWRMAVRIADEVTNGRTYVSDVGESTHYHADYVEPRWTRRLERKDVIGHHIFYALQSRHD